MRRAPILLLAAFAALAAAGPASAQQIVVSPRPDSVDVTVYRDPDRDASEAMERDWLNGYALVSETRRITLPEGESEIRFEGVAAGMVPQSAIVSGFPQDVVERNRDALLLSPATLIARSLGRRVHIRRTNIATGRVRQMDAVIRSGADGAVVLQTCDGFEALRCTGLSETLTYDRVPPGLSARPTLSVRARATRRTTATVTLSYIATGFDWQANYIANLSEDGTRVELFAWLTLASTDETSFPNADTQAVAGEINRDEVDPQEPEGGPIQLRCWPHSTTSDIPLEQFAQQPPPPPMAGMVSGEDLMVTGSRLSTQAMTSYSPVAVVTAEEEALGDVKLYRIPEPVTIAANSQKQVALLQRPDVRVALVHRIDLSPWQDMSAPSATERWLVGRNNTSDGLGLPLPAGQMLIFAEGADRPVLIGEGMLEDRAVGDDVEILLGDAPGVTARLERPARPEGEHVLTVTNDGPQPVRFEANLQGFGEIDMRGAVGRRNGHPLLAADVPANGTITLRFRRR